MSNLGLQLVYDLVNQDPALVCERVFSPEDGARPLSVESSRPLEDFPVILCSVSFEQDIPSLIRMFLLANIAPLSEERQGKQIEAGTPLIIAGGVSCFINPETVAPFADMIVVGEAEPVLPDIFDLLEGKVPGGDRLLILREMAVSLPGCYVPRFYDFQYDFSSLFI